MNLMATVLALSVTRASARSAQSADSQEDPRDVTLEVKDITLDLQDFKKRVANLTIIRSWKATFENATSCEDQQRNSPQRASRTATKSRAI